MIRDRKDAGAALLSILLIVATMAVAALIATQAIAQQTELHKLSARKTTAIWAARSAETLALSAAQGLADASRLPAVGDPSQRMAELALPLEGGSVTLSMQEQPPCLNLNALGSSDPSVHQRSVEGLRILLEDFGVPAVDARNAVAILADWIDVDQDTRPHGAEEGDYLSMRRPNRPANQHLLSTQELAAIEEFSPALRAGLAPFVCTLPHSGIAEINLNALTPMSAALLRALSGGTVSADEARRFIETRPVRGWPDIQSARESLTGRPQMDIALSGIPLNVRGEYFSGAGTVSLDVGNWDFRFTMRVGTDSAAEIIWRDLGGSL